MRAAGFRVIQVWIPDTRSEGFSEELRRQVRLVSLSDKKDDELMDFLDASFDEIEGAW
jgi:hypothetical protein